MKTCWLTVLCAAMAVLSNADDSGPQRKIIGVGDSDLLSILRGCLGTAGSPGQKGEPGEKGEPGPSESTAKMGPTGEKEPGESGRKEEHPARDCKDLQDRGEVLSDWYTIFPDGKTPLKVLCDMHTDGGGWMVFQRRSDGSVDFFRDWKSYKIGFGSRMNEFWLGNENLHKITSSGYWMLRIDFQDVEYNNYFAKYDTFKILDESQKYKLLLGTFTDGNAGNSMSYHNDVMFTTKDQDNDDRSDNCANIYKGGWWYKKCSLSNLNGLYRYGAYNSSVEDGIAWKTMKYSSYSFKFTEMKIRPYK